LRADMRQQMAEVTEAATARYSQLVGERHLKLAALHADRTVLHDAVMQSLPYWIVRFDHMAEYAWNHGHVLPARWAPQWKVMVAEVAGIFAEDGEKAEVLPQLDEAVLSVNAWTGAQMRKHLAAVRKRAHELELLRPSRCVERGLRSGPPEPPVFVYTVGG
jgi:hypothetical protein